jgi:hypothetical protein
VDLGVAAGVVTGVQLRALREVAVRLDEQGLHAESGTILSVVEAVTRARGVSTGDAARVLGVTQQTVRNWVRAGVLAGWCDATGHFLVAPDALGPARAMRSALAEADRPQVSDVDIDAEIAAVRAERRQRSVTAR